MSRYWAWIILSQAHAAPIQVMHHALDRKDGQHDFVFIDDLRERRGLEAVRLEEEEARINSILPPEEREIRSGGPGEANLAGNSRPI